MSKYITKKRMKEAGIAGHVNIPYGTEVEEVDGLIIYKGAAVCAITSRNAHLHFAKNDDGKGLERGALADHEDHFLWNHEFFEAPVEDLQYIAGLIGARG